LVRKRYFNNFKLKKNNFFILNKDFGTNADPRKAFDLQRKFAPNGPLVRNVN
jgi:hypothetical protein